MKITFLTSASVLIEDNGTKILTDPWFIDGEFYGSWSHYPYFDFNRTEYDDVDFIYISHIHPDHCSIKTLKELDKNIPILIHNFHFKFLNEQIQRLGFKTIEVGHNERIRLKDDMHVRILAADNCDPSICMKYFGCGVAEKTFGSTSIDSMCVIDNGKEVIVNTNDCPFELGQTSASLIKKEYGKIDFLLLGYSSATAYPQCFNLTESELLRSKTEIIQSFFSKGESYVNLFNPKFYMPFAGRYVLSGKNHLLTWKKATPELEEAANYFKNSSGINHEKSRCVILNSKTSFDISKGESSDEYIPINFENKQDYVQSILSKIKYDYESDDIPKIDEILELIPLAYQRFENVREKLGFSSNTKILIDISQEKMLVISTNGKGYEIVEKDNHNYEKYVLIKTDYRLLKRLLSGPKFAHWNNAEIGSHLMFERNPNIYERGLFYCLNFFHK